MFNNVGNRTMEYARSSDGSNGKSTKRDPHLTAAEIKVETTKSLRRRKASVSRKDVEEGGCKALEPVRTLTASSSSPPLEEIPNRLPSWYIRKAAIPKVALPRHVKPACRATTELRVGEL